MCIYIYIHRYCYTYSYTHIYVRWEHEVEMTEFMSWATQVLVAPVAWLILQARCIDTRSGFSSTPSCTNKGEHTTQGQFPNDFFVSSKVPYFSLGAEPKPQDFFEVIFSERVDPHVQLCCFEVKNWFAGFRRENSRDTSSTNYWWDFSAWEVDM